MMRRPIIEPRRRFFLGCEGESEQSYGALLQGIADRLGLRVHIDTVVLGGGDHFKVIQSAQDKRRERARRHGPFQLAAVILDADRVGQIPERDSGAARAAAGLHLIWQRPCHEALLLRHLCGPVNRELGTCKEATRLLRRKWPTYAKPIPAVRLAERITIDEVRRVAEADAELNAFLHALGMT